MTHFNKFLSLLRNFFQVGTFGSSVFLAGSAAASASAGAASSATGSSASAAGSSAATVSVTGSSTAGAAMVSLASCKEQTC